MFNERFANSLVQEYFLVIGCDILIIFLLNNVLSFQGEVN